MSAYRENRRADAVPRLNAISKNEAMEASDLKRQQTYERERERLATELKHAQSGKKFAALINAPKKKKP